MLNYTAHGLKLSAWDILQQNPGWSGTQEDFERFWDLFWSRMEVAVENEATVRRKVLRREKAREYTVYAGVCLLAALPKIAAVAAIVISLIAILWG